MKTIFLQSFCLPLLAMLAVGLFAPAQPQPQFLLPTVAEYPALIEQLQGQIDAEATTCQYVTSHEAVGTKTWFEMRSTEPSCRALQQLERRLERARGEFKARLCK